MEAVLGVIVLMMVLFAAAGTFLAVRTVRAVRSGVRRNVEQARRAVEDTALRARSYARTGALGEVAALRLSLRTAVTGTREALEAGAAGDSSVREALRLLDRLSGHAHSLDGELRALEREPHQDRIAARLPELRRLTGRVTHSADSLRWAAQERARRFDEDELTVLAREIEIEAGALRHWTPAAPGGEGRGELGDSGVSGRPVAEGASGEGGRAEPDDPRRSAITDPGPRTLRKRA